MDKLIRLRITYIKEETPDAKTFFLASTGDPITYSAGQFLTLLFPKTAEQDRRNYSISTAPHEPALAITIKKIANGEYSRRLVDAAKAGDEFDSLGASGFFTLPQKLNDIHQIFFFAAGSGITPIISLIKECLQHYPRLRLVLVYSNRNKEYATFYDALNDLERAHDQLDIVWLFSESKNLETARLNKSLIERLVRERSTHSMTQTLFYLCGSFDYMRMATIQLLTMDVPVAHIRKEQFEIIRPETRVRPPDLTPHLVTILQGNKSQAFVAGYPSTILAAARHSNLPLNFSCEAGRCGTCAMKCIEGKVWMSYNEVLLDNELADGWILTCTGYPIDGNVVLK